MKDNKNESLVSALSWAGLSELPPKDTKENVYVRALALVAKSDGSESYVALKKGENGDDKIVKDFGSIFPIAKVKEVYPYNYLDSRFVPEKTLESKEDMVNWLNFNDKKQEGLDYSKMSKKELKKRIIALASLKQLASEN